MSKRWSAHRRLACGNLHGNPHFQAAWNKYGESSFEFRLLEECSEDILVEREDAWMVKLRSCDSAFGYNMKNASQAFVSEETRRKMRKSRLGKHLSKETKEKISKFHLGRKRPEGTGEKISKALRGRKRSDESKLRISIGHMGIPSCNKGKKFTEERCRQMSESTKGAKHWNFGKHRSLETRKKIGDAQKGEKHHFYGKRHSGETRRKMTAAHIKHYALKKLGDDQ